MDNEPSRRISQLDACELDDELSHIIKSRFSICWKYFKSNWTITFEPEISATIKLLLWKFTLFANDATVGQRLLDLKYRSVSRTTVAEISKRQKILYAVFSIFGPWISKRAHTFSTFTSNVRFSHEFWKFMQQLEVAWKVGSLLNFLVFLTQGKYQYLLERILGIQAMFPKPQGVRQIGFEYMDRELLWHGFAEFLFFVLPLINVKKIKNSVRNLIGSANTHESITQRTAADLKECVVCGNWPYNPQQIGCKHVFCYYCVQANVAADPEFCCPLCAHKVTGSDSIQPLLMTSDTVLTANLS